MLAAAADHHASPVAAANPECALFYRRQNNEAFSLVQQILGNVIWNVENLFQNFALLLDALFFFYIVRGKCGQ